jgi:hypothetical protein
MSFVTKLYYVALFVFSTVGVASSFSKKDAAVRNIDDCFRTDLKGRGCTPTRLQDEGDTLLSLYKLGDRSVLPPLIRLGALSIGLRPLDGFYTAAILADTNDFLAALYRTMTSESRQNFLLVGTACGRQNLSSEQFHKIRDKLSAVAQRSLTFHLAEECRRSLESANVSLVAKYFPPKTFTGGAADFVVQWYASALYLLDERPLWPPSPDKTVYRFTWLRSFHDLVSIAFTVFPDGSGQIRTRVLKRDAWNPQSKLTDVTAADVSRVEALIATAEFWQMTTEGGSSGCDGAEWILEGTQRGLYHIVSRWDARKTPFGKAALALVQLAGYKVPDAELY